MNENQRPASFRKSADELLMQFRERANELKCLLRVEEVLNSPDAGTEAVCAAVVEAIPSGWQYPDACVARITLEGQSFATPGFQETEWVQRAVITAHGTPVGEVLVCYTKEMPRWDIGPFLKEEAKLIETIGDRLGHWIMYQKMRQAVLQRQPSREEHNGKAAEWQVVLQMLRQTDRNLYDSVCRKMLNHLCWTGIEEADQLMKSHTFGPSPEEIVVPQDWNQPHRTRHVGFSSDLYDEVFRIAAEHLSPEEILRLVQKWVQEDKLTFLVEIVNRNLTLTDVADAVRRYFYLVENEQEVQSPNQRGIEVELIRRFLSDQLQFINVAKQFCKIRDFYHLLDSVIFTSESHGKLGGKSAGMYLASQILKQKAAENELLADIKLPKTYYVSSDIQLHFVTYNNFAEVVEQKYKPINQVRFEYPHIVQTFKSARFPPDVASGLSVALDDFGEVPLIVRSSSLLEDRAGAAFSGKYKSLFLANQGSKAQRLAALLDAIAEVYASTFGPDPIEYRAERGLLDFQEEMGIMIQNVVGTRVGKYYLPAFAGVAFSRNEFRWSPRIKRDDGLVRLVPGLGTRAVDRLSDDYPVMLAPGQPGLRVNPTPDEVARYSPSKIDVINLETVSFDTIPMREFLREAGSNLPLVEHMVSVYRDNSLRTPLGLWQADEESGEPIVTFEGLITRTPFIKQIKTVLQVLEQTIGVPVDVEFAHDGRHLHLLQCRPQSYSATSAPAPIPKGVPREQIVFTARKHVTNGLIPNVTHIVYVDPQRYGSLPDQTAMSRVGRAIGHLNKVLPKRQFILMGPGRWGSRGDIKLGVSVTYSDINNTAALIEIARRKGNYVPDLSFGTHFFQDLVEAQIRYLPLYPDEEDNVFNERFLLGSENILAQMAPDFADLQETIHLVDVPKNSGGRVLRVCMNADLDEAAGVLAPPLAEGAVRTEVRSSEAVSDERFWRWRFQMVERMARSLDADRFGVVNLYVFGSTKNATAGPASDIDVLIHFRGTAEQLAQLQNWLEGWSLCLAETNYMQTGYRTGGLLDVHIVTDDDIAKKTSWAAKIGAVTDAARPLPLGKSTGT